MWKVTIKGLLAHKIRFVLTAVAVILGVSLMAGSTVLTATIQKTFDDLFADIGRGTDSIVRAHEVLSSDFGTGQRPNIPASLLNVVRTAPGVEAAEGNIQGYAQVVGHDGKAVGGGGPPAFGLAWDPSPKLNQFHIVDGHEPQSDDQIVVDRHTADKGKLQVGERVKVLTVLAPKEYTLVGVARFGSVDSLAGASITLFTLPEIQQLAQAPNQFAQIAVVARPGVSQTQLRDNIRQTLAENNLSQYEVETGKQYTKENQDALHKTLGFINTAFLIFAFVTLIIGAFIIYNTFSIVVAQRLREMALMRAIGASRRQVLSSVVGESLVVGVIASALGVAAGVGVAIGLRSIMNAFGFEIPSTGVVVKPSAVITGLVVGTVVTFLSAVVPARQAARIPPVAAMRDVALERPVKLTRRLIIGLILTGGGIALLLAGLFGGNGISSVGLGALLILLGVFALSPLFARSTALAIGRPLAKIRGITGELARENAARNPRRTAITGAAVMIAVSLVGFITIFAASANASISDAIDSQLKTDYIIGPQGNNGPQGGLSPKLDQAIAQLPEIQTSTPLRLGDVAINGSRHFVGAADATASTLFDFGDVEGHMSDIKPDGLGVSKRVAEDHHWHVGTVVDATFVKTGRQKLRIDFIYKNNGLAGDYILSIAGYEANYTQQLDFQIFAKLKPGVTAKQGRDAIERVTAAYPNAKVKDNAEYKADQKAQVNQVLILVYVLLILAIFVSAIGIMNTLTLSVYERTRELGLLRAVGSSRRQIRSAVRWESVIIALFGTVLGLGIAIFFGWAVVRALKDQGFSKFSLAPVQLIIWVIVFAVLAILAAIFPARRAAKLDVLKAVSTE